MLSDCKSSPFTSSKHNYDTAKAMLLAAKSIAFTREKSHDYDVKTAKTLIHNKL